MFFTVFLMLQYLPHFIKRNIKNTLIEQSAWVFIINDDILCHCGVFCNVYVTRHRVVLNGIRWAENDVPGKAIHNVCFGSSHVCPISIQHLHLSSYKVPTMYHCNVLLATPTSFLMEHTNLEEAELIRVVQLLVDNKLLIVMDGEVSVCLFVCAMLYFLMLSVGLASYIFAYKYQKCFGWSHLVVDPTSCWSYLLTTSCWSYLLTTSCFSSHCLPLHNSSSTWTTQIKGQSSRSQLLIVMKPVRWGSIVWLFTLEYHSLHIQTLRRDKGVVSLSKDYIASQLF